MINYKLNDNIVESENRLSKEEIIKQLKPSESSIIQEMTLTTKRKTPQGRGKSIGSGERQRTRRFKFIKGVLLEI